MIRLRHIFFTAVIAVAATTSMAKMQIFAGLNGASVFDASLPFKDLMWQYETWGWGQLNDRTATNRGYFGGLDRYPLPILPVPIEQLNKLAPLDENNYPTEVPFTYDGVQYRPVWLFNWFLPTRLFPMGTYTFIAEGKGVVEFGWAKDVRIELKGGKTVYEFQITEMPAINIFNSEAFNAGQGAKQSGLVMTILQSDPNDHVRNIHLIRPDLNGGNSWAQDYETCPFNPQWLEDHKMYKALRFMDWINANQNGVVRWDDRITPTKAKAPDKLREHAPYMNAQWITAGHIPYEFMIQAANTIGCDLWLTVPARANEDYVRNLATLCKNMLKPDIKVYLEWANETWNTMFIGLHSVSFVKNNYNSNVNDLYDMHAYMSVRNSIIFDEVLGADRVISLVAGQQSNSGVGDNIMSALKKPGINPTNYKIDGYSITGYFGTQGPTRKDNQAAKTTADANNMKLYMYEGGTGGGRSPAMYDLYKNALTVYEQDGFENFNAFVAVSGWGQWGDWGHMEYANQPLADAHKYRALYDWAVTNNQYNPATVLPTCQGTSVINSFQGGFQSRPVMQHTNATTSFDLAGKRTSIRTAPGLTIVKEKTGVHRILNWWR